MSVFFSFDSSRRGGIPGSRTTAGSNCCNCKGTFISRPSLEQGINE